MKLRPLLQRMPKPALGLLAAQAVLLCLLLLSLSHFFSVGTSEVLRATANQQRILINAKTGEILGQTDVSKTEAPTHTASTSEVPAAIPAKDAPAPPATEPDTDKPVAAPTTDAQTQHVAQPEPSSNPATAANSQGSPAQDIASILDITPATIAPVTRSSNSLVIAPAPEVTDTSSGKPLPKRGAKNIVPSKLYARGYSWPQDEKEKKPTIVILVSGLGQNADAMAAALTLPAQISFSFTPYTQHGDDWVVWARNAGHEVWLDIPAQTAAFPASDPGPLGIYSPLGSEKITENLMAIMATFSGYVGFSLPIDQTIINNADLMAPILAELHKRGLLLAVPSSTITPETMTHLVPYKDAILFADMVLDSTLEANAIRAKFRKLESAAQKKGVAFGVISSFPLSIRLLKDWSHTLKDTEFVLAPVSALSRIHEKPPADSEKKAAPKAAH